MLGLPYLDAESLPLVIGALLTLINSRERRLPNMGSVRLQAKGQAEDGAVVGDGVGRSAGSSSSYDAVEMARTDAIIGSYDAVEMARALVRRERGMLEGAFKRAVLQLECDASKEDEDEEDDDDVDDEDEEDDDDDNDDDDNDGGEEGEEGVGDDDDDGAVGQLPVWAPGVGSKRARNA